MAEDTIEFEITDEIIEESEVLRKLFEDQNKRFQKALKLKKKIRDYFQKSRKMKCQKG